MNLNQGDGTFECMMMELVNRYFNEHQTASERYVVMRTGCDRGTLRKIKKGKPVDLYRIDILTMIDFTTFFLNNDDSAAIELMKKSPILKTRLERDHSYILRSPRRNMNQGAKNLDFADIHRVFCTILSSMKYGISKKEAEMMIGVKGKMIMNKLVDESIIRLDENNRYVHYEYDKSKPNTILNFTKKQTQMIISVLIKFYNEENSGTGTNYIGFVCQSWKPQFFNKLQGMLKNVHEVAVTEGNLEENIGEIPGFILFALDQFIPKEDQK